LSRGTIRGVCIFAAAISTTPIFRPLISYRVCAGAKRQPEFSTAEGGDDGARGAE
jgi:hypothetical protein